MPGAANLDFDRAPPLGVVFGCLLPAPWIGSVAGLLLAFGPTRDLPERFAPLTLALVHALAVGMLLPIMLGALFQLFPVVGGVPVRASRWISPFVAPLCATAAAALAAGFLGQSTDAFRLAGLVAAPLLGVPALLLLAAGRHIVATNATTRTLHHIGLSLLIALIAGALMALMFGLGWSIPLPAVLDIHIGWAVGGWLASLVAGVAATVLPMFWQTPRPTNRLNRMQPWWLWSVLMAGGVLELSYNWTGWQVLAWAMLAALASIGLYAVLKAKRKHDPAWPLWLASTMAWLLAAVLGLYAGLLPQPWPLAWWIGVLALVGGGVLPINAMLGKIIPFLVWLHLRRLLPPRQRVPAMQNIIAPSLQYGQAALVLLALFLLLALPAAPSTLALWAGLTFAVSQAWLAILLMRALGKFAHTSWQHRGNLTGDKAGARPAS